MKLELSLPERPGLLHALPVCDLFLMLWIAFVLGTALTRQTGVAVELPASQFQLERYRETVVITLASGEGQPQIYFGRDAVSADELQRQLQRLHDAGAQADTIVLLRTDASTPVGAERRIKEMALALDFQVALLGSEEVTAEPVQPPVPAPESEPGKEAE